MYLWIVLATFITLLYSYNVSVRADMDRAMSETRAQVILTKFLAQHNAIKEYLNEQAPEKLGLSRVPYYPGDGFNTTTGSNYADDGSAQQGGYNYKAQVEKYLPYGFEPDSEVVSKVFCLADGKQESPQCVSGAEGSCCNDDFMGVYVISFRQIPPRWFNRITNLPNADLIGAMSRIGGFGSTFGYLDEVDHNLVIAYGSKLVNSTTTDSNGNVVATGKALQYRQVFDAVMADPDFKNKKCDDPETHCLYAIQQIYR